MRTTLKSSLTALMSAALVLPPMLPAAAAQRLETDSSAAGQAFGAGLDIPKLPAGFGLSTQALRAGSVDKAPFIPTLANLRNAARAFVAAGCESTPGGYTLPEVAAQIFGEFGRIAGKSICDIARNFDKIYPAFAYLSGVLPILRAGVFVIGSAVGFAPSVLVMLMGSGLLTMALFNTRLRAAQEESRNEARQWQMDQAALAFNHRPSPDTLRLPSYLNTADIFIGGRSVSSVSEGNIQSYIVAAFAARESPTDERKAQDALRLLKHIVDSASVDPGGGDWDR
ncbi:MAG: hypothetical protein HYZ75_12905 [Elusimicrobia bacterium]|nr:hypothetical protein [Elusimicrobiota bacterium]